MDETHVIIVGGGPSGLALGLALAQYEVQSVILERETHVVSDPRGVWLTGDAVRILHGLGLGDQIESIGQAAVHANFHQTSFKTPPFFQIPFGTSNSLEHALPEGLQMSQPKLEDALRRKVEESSFCDLRSGCNVIGRPEENPPIVTYKSTSGSMNTIKGQFLVGADGKTGIVRKHFLEHSAGIKQEAGIYPYEGVWVASNLRMTLPNRDTHPEFPLWKFGYTPEQVYDLFWPVGWHFCAPPGKPTATGRFGPEADRTWRHEFKVDNEGSGPIYSEELLWEHLMPNITLERNPADDQEFGQPVQYPRDCIEIMRCRPFKFVHKCVNKWFHKRTILIGDAAHVFPPFAGQGVASGLRDGHQLAWRLALLLQEEKRIDERLSLLEGWALERRQSVDVAAFMSKLSGSGCNREPTWWVFLLTRTIWFLQKQFPVLWRLIDTARAIEYKGFSEVAGGFHMNAHRGGLRLAQVHMRCLPRDKETTLLSDRILSNRKSIFTLLIICSSNENSDMKELFEEAKAAIGSSSIAPNVLSAESIVIYVPELGDNGDMQQMQSKIKIMSPAPVSEITALIADTYDSAAFVNRLGRSTKFAILRPDWFIFGCARDVDDLNCCLRELKRKLYI